MLLLAACRMRNHTRPTNHQQCLRQPTTSRGEPTERSSNNIVVRNRWIGQRETVPPRSYHGGAFFLPDLWSWYTRPLAQETRIVHSLSSVVGAQNLVKRGEGSSIP
jgi:hypothetical protein